MPDLARTGARADADRDDPRLLAAQHRRVDAGAVLDLQRDAIAGLVLGGEHARDTRRTLVVLAPRHRGAARRFDECNPVGLGRGVARNDLGDRVHEIG